ncbi:coiled-coil domain-containing protein 125-like isoform X2 [Physella acuta]|uniref:coiled-coil domain-containing protein 125-like isoform X2 n=1 Tax=Physella acuta TaxID=109671 RepID=UPI0027DD7721|nr:coiled-coil domain-containing protein 125-like isoform X2 [Physella acuta]
MDYSEKLEDEIFDAICGDLGLGESTRSSCYLNFENVKHGHNSNVYSHPDSKGQYGSLEQQSNSKTFNMQHSHTLQDTGQRNGTNTQLNVSSEDFPSYADVPYGTSLRQQKLLYEVQIEKLRKQFAASQNEDSIKNSKSNKDSKNKNSFKMSGKEIEMKLNVALQEMDELKIELDACRKRLDAKYKAVAILKQQAELADTELKNTERKATETSRKLEQELSKLQFELEWRESSFIDSQQTWAERFDRVCQENGILMSKLEARNEELRKANAHKTALARERDELLALLDVTERQKYEQGKSKVSEDDYGSFSSTELAVLGACKCRVSTPEPCGCAHAAANLRKEVAKLREELECSHQRREETSLTVDAYRTAFEEQLARNKSMTMRLSQLATLSSRSAKAKAAIKWLIQVLNDDDYSPPKPIETAVEADKGHMLSSMSLQELVTLLSEMVSEKNEALAHQKLAAQVLANKLLKYEKKEGKKSDSDSSTDARVKKSEGKHKKQTPNYKLDIYIKDNSVSDAYNDVFKLERNSNVESSSFEEDYFYDPIENNIEEANSLGHTSNHKSNELKCTDSLQSVNIVTAVNLNRNHETANHSDHVSPGCCEDASHTSSNHVPVADQLSGQASKSNIEETNGVTSQENIFSQALDESDRSAASNTEGATQQLSNS